MEWVTATTLGGKAKKFKWKYSALEGLYIKREINGREKITNFSLDDLQKIIDFIVDNGEVDLANNVQKLSNGSEKDGLGRFIYENTHRNISDAQAASQLVAVLFNLDILYFNGKKRGMKFKIKNPDWERILKNHLYMKIPDDKKI